MTATETETIARRYIDAVGAHRLDALDYLLDDGLVARLAGTPSTKGEWLQALERLLPALVRNDIREVFVAGDRACVVYDFVTDTPAGTVLCAELLTVAAGRILDIELLLDRVTFAPVNATLAERAAAR
ncbi:MAG: nuclear transport factor 2 family protein [Pseudolysinimonas sp.]